MGRNISISFVTRYFNNGIIDTSFGIDGYLDPYLGNIDSAVPNLVHYQDSVYIYGIDFTYFWDPELRRWINYNDLFINKYLMDSTLDTSFDLDGILEIPNHLRQADYLGMSQLNDRLLIWYSIIGEMNSHAFVYDMDGVLDENFGGENGVTVENLYFTDMKPIPGEVIFFTGYPSEFTNEALGQLNIDGSFNTNFYDVGYTELSALGYSSFYSHKSTIHEGADGGILIAGSITDNESGYSYPALWNYLFSYQAVNVKDYINVFNSNNNNIEVGEDGGILGNDTVSIYYEYNGSNIPLAEFENYFSEDLDFSNIDGASDQENKKSIIAGIDKPHSFYIPKNDNDNKLRICPKAQNLNEVNENCQGSYILDASSSNVNIVEINGLSYWRVNNLTDTGGQSFNLELPDTGLAFIPYFLFGISLCILFIIKYIIHYTLI